MIRYIVTDSPNVEGASTTGYLTTSGIWSGTAVLYNTLAKARAVRDAKLLSYPRYANRIFIHKISFRENIDGAGH